MDSDSVFALASKELILHLNDKNMVLTTVLIITGDKDRFFPAWNAKRLSRAIPGSCLEIIKNCGHFPQEEKAEEFVSIVDKFLQRTFGAAQPPWLQVVT